jgi:tellurite resistance protein TehA-like permease
MFETDIDQTTYLSAISIASSTLIELVALIPGQEWHNWQYVALALWWASVLIAMVASVTVYWILIRDEEVSLHNLSPSMMYPVTGVLSTASAGSVVVSYTPLSTHLSMSVVVVSYLLLGLGEIPGLPLIRLLYI